MNGITPEALRELATLALESEPHVGEVVDSDRFTLLGHIPYEEAGKRDLLVILKELSGCGPIALNSQLAVGSVEYDVPTSWSREGPGGFRRRGWAIELHIKLSLEAE